MTVLTNRNTVISFVFIFAVMLGMSIFLNVAYIYTLCALSGWVAIGHLVTLDDDMPEGWSNPEGSAEFWNKSKIACVVKFFVFISLVILVIAFPSLGNYGK